MAIRRFYCDDLSGDRITLSDDQAAHARKSLRLSVGETVELYDGRGGSAACEIVELSRQMVVDVREREYVEPLLPVLDLAVAIPKGPRADALVDAVSQLGVDRLIPLITEYSVVEPGANKLTRYERIAAESAKQCRRAYLMTIDPLTKLEAFFESDAYDRVILSDLQGLQTEELLDGSSMIHEARRVLLLVGPEGGWSARERERAAEAGWVSWRFGPNVLRVENAAAAGVAILRAMTEPRNQQTEID